VTRLLLLLCSVAVSGCVNHSVALAAGERLRPTSPEAIEILDGLPGRDNEVVGTVHSHCRTNWLAAFLNCHEDDMRQELRVRAGELGADAVVSVERSSFWQFEWTDVHLRGKAVRWTAPAP
jgi:hypothetical protein